MNPFKWWAGFMTASKQALLLDLGLLAARLGYGGMMAIGHGWGKLKGFPENHESFSDPLGVGPSLSMALAVFAEFFCGIFLALGFATRFAAFNLWFTMTVAAFVIHGSDPFFRASPTQGFKEFAMLYWFAFLLIMLAGPGRFSIDRLIMKKMK